MGASWYLLNNHCVLSTSEGGVGGSEDIWRWPCHQIVNAQQEFHWFNNMHWASTIHTGTMQDYESKTLNTTHTGVWAGWHLQFYYSASQLQAALSVTNGRSRQRKREEEKFCSPTNRATAKFCFTFSGQRGPEKGTEQTKLSESHSHRQPLSLKFKHQSTATECLLLCLSVYSISTIKVLSKSNHFTFQSMVFNRLAVY